MPRIRRPRVFGKPRPAVYQELCDRILTTVQLWVVPQGRTTGPIMDTAIRGTLEWSSQDQMLRLFTIADDISSYFALTEGFAPLKSGYGLLHTWSIHQQSHLGHRLQIIGFAVEPRTSGLYELSHNDDLIRAEPGNNLTKPGLTANITAIITSHLQRLGLAPSQLNDSTAP